MLGAVSFDPDRSDTSWIARVASACALTRIDLPRGSAAVAPALSRNSDPDLQFLTANLLLTRRGELLSRLGLNPAAESARSDQDLVLLAYRKWGEECPVFLEGDYAFALWDENRRRVFCCVDHLGAIPLIYWRDGDRFAAGASNAELLTVPEVPRVLNRRKLRGLCVAGGQHYLDTDTFHAGIHSLPSASTLIIEADRHRSRAYWEPAVRPGLVPRRPEEAFEALRNLLFDAVGDRLRLSHSPGVLLSGGLDSSAIAAIAARALDTRNLTLTGISAVLSPEHRARYGDEKEFAEAFAAFPNVRMEYVVAPERGVFDFLDHPRDYEDGLMRTSRNYLFEAISAAAQARGLDLLFTGNSGELGATVYGSGYYVELLAHLRLGLLRRELRSASSVNGASPLRLLARDAKRLLQIGPAFVPSAFFRREFLAQCDIPALRFSRRPDHRVRQFEMLKHYLRKHALRTETTLGNIPMRTPLADKRVIEFCLAAGGDLKVRDGYNRYLVRGALASILPEKIRWRTSKTQGSPDYPARYNAQLDKARAFVAQIRPGDPVREIVDVDLLSRMLVPVREGEPFWTALIRVPASLRTILFLRQFTEFQP